MPRSPAPSPAPPAVPSASRVLARSGGENFPVASRLLPASTRRHLMAVYGFARLVDDLGDEAPGDRLALLDWLEGEVDFMYRGGTPAHPLLRSLADTVRTFGLPREPLDRLIAANRRDQAVARYPTFADLLAYCELSANPVGHLVLGVFRAITPKRLELSDAICTGLQLVEHWQDVAEDYRRGRIYVPLEDLERFGVAPEELGAPRPSPGFRRLLGFEVRRAADLLDRGAPLARELGGRAGAAVAAFWAGGRAALEAIAGADYDVLGQRPHPSGWVRARWLTRALVQVWRPA